MIGVPLAEGRGGTYGSRSRRFAPYAWVVFVIFALLLFMFAVFPGTWIEEQGVELTPIEDTWLLSTSAGLAVVLTVAIAVTAFRRGERWAW